jgi:multidrug efflux system membrane fusion protein
MKTTPSLFLTLTLLAAAHAAPATTTASKPIVVRAAPVEYSSAALPVRASGLLARRTEAGLSFKTSGIIESVVVRAGDTVAADQLLARLQPDEIEAQVAQARSVVQKARRDFARTEKLQAGSVATVENLQDVRTAVELAEAQLRVAEFNRRHSVIRAPAGGRILRRLAEPNELVAAGRPILEFAADSDGWIVRAGLPDRDLARLRIGDRAEVNCAAGTPAVPGRIVQIAGGTDLATRTTEIEIALDAEPPLARSGSVATATLLPADVPERPVVPLGALIEGDGASASLFVLEPGATTARRVVVEVEALLGAQAYLRTALPRGARLVVAGGEYLRDGAVVSVTP